MPTLRVSPTRRESASAFRRRALRARLRAEAEAARLARLAWLAKPKRLRGMIYCEARRFGAHRCMALVYEFPDRRGNALVRIWRIGGRAPVCYELMLSLNQVC